MADHPTLNVEVVEGSSYTTLTQSFRKGEVYPVSILEWENMRFATHPITGKTVFARTDKAATVAAPASTNKADVVVGTGITITHNAPEAMTKTEASKAGLGAFFSDSDTGAALAGTGGVTEESGPSGHEGLDDDENADAVVVGEPEAAQKQDVVEEPTETPVEVLEGPSEPQEEPVVTQPAPVGKRIILNRPGPRNQSLKDSLPFPSAQPAGDEEEVQV